MDLAEGVADLHVHTTASDGTSTVDERIAQARERDLDAIALTDHDAITDELTEPTTTESGVEVITGVEVRADVFDTKVEILGYYVDPETKQLRDVLARVRQFRHERNEQTVERLADATGLDLDYAAMRDETSGVVGRPHLADILVDAGVVDNIGEAFDEYLATDGDAYVEMNRLPATTVLDAIHAAGGVASLAHPGRIRSSRVPQMVADLAVDGLDAIEVYYPYDTDGGPDAYADIGIEEAAELADEHDLLVTGGSDCHGPDSGKFRIGSVRVDAETLSTLRDVANQ